jgi:hypothetical protein
MHISFSSLVVVALCGQTPVATYRTTNFVIHADTPEIAKLVGDSAERSRKDVGKLWLDKEPAAWAAPCRIRVSLNMGRVEGFTDLSFCQGKVRDQKIAILGPLDRIMKGLLPHELTHVLFAHHFGVQPPRWADEGGAILSEDRYQDERQSKLFRKILAEDRSFSLRRLLEMRQYPDDVACLYAEGHSISRFLVDAKGRKVFLAFVADGLKRGWDQAVQDQYGFENVEQLETAWLGWVEKRSDPGSAVRNGKLGTSAATSITDSGRSLGETSLKKRRTLSFYSNLSNIPY